MCLPALSPQTEALNSVRNHWSFTNSIKHCWEQQSTSTKQLSITGDITDSNIPLRNSVLRRDIWARICIIGESRTRWIMFRQRFRLYFPVTSQVTSPIQQTVILLLAIAGAKTPHLSNVGSTGFDWSPPSEAVSHHFMKATFLFFMSKTAQGTRPGWCAYAPVQVKSMEGKARGTRPEPWWKIPDHLPLCCGASSS